MCINCDCFDRFPNKIFGHDDDRLVSDDSDLIAISDKLRLVSITDEVKEEGKLVDQNAELAKSDEELARKLQVSSLVI